MSGSVTYEYGTGPVRAAPAPSHPEYHPAAFAQTPPPSTAAYSRAPSAPSTTTAASINQAHQHQQLQLYRGDPHRVADRRMMPYVAPAAPAVYREVDDDAYHRGKRASVRRTEGRESGGGARARKSKAAKRRGYEEHRPTLGDTMVMIIRVVVDAIKTPSGKR